MSQHHCHLQTRLFRNERRNELCVTYRRQHFGSVLFNMQMMTFESCVVLIAIAAACCHAHKNAYEVVYAAEVELNEGL